MTYHVSDFSGQNTIDSISLKLENLKTIQSEHSEALAEVKKFVKINELFRSKLSQLSDFASNGSGCTYDDVKTFLLYFLATPDQHLVQRTSISINKSTQTDSTVESNSVSAETIDAYEGAQKFCIVFKNIRDLGIVNSEKWSEGLTFSKQKFYVVCAVRGGHPSPKFFQTQIIRKSTQRYNSQLKFKITTEIVNQSTAPMKKYTHDSVMSDLVADGVYTLWTNLFDKQVNRKNESNEFVDHAGGLMIEFSIELSD